MADFIYTMKDLRKVVPPKREILKGIWLSFFYGAKIGVLGLNGAGKSSLLKIMAGVDQDFIGEAFLGKGFTVGYLEQEPKLDPAKNVMDNVADGVGEKMRVKRRWDEISAKFAEPMEDDEMNKLIEEQGKLQDAMDAGNLWDLERQLEIAMDALRCPPGDADVTTLSGGERRRVALCRLLLSHPDLLLLDEPTNHLDAESVAWLERFLKDYTGTVVAVTHDRYFLDNVAGWILELDRGAGIPWEGNYTSWLEQKKNRLQQEEKTESVRQKTLEREFEWVKMAPRARQAKSKARLAAYEKMLAEESADRIDSVEIYIPPGPRLGNVVIEATNLRKGYGDKLLIDDLSFKIDQSRDSLSAEKSVWEEITGGNELLMLGKREINSRAYCSWFNFRGADQQKKVGTLSGGERNRVQMAKLLQSGGNLLLLDEPTNDLDVDTLRALEDALLEFAGCAVVISHDRWFLDRIATHILAFEGDSQVVFFEGNYQDYEKNLHERIGADADTPHRIKYKPLAR
ncbi:MAG: ABC transporter ATP-binding protein [Candidatus Eisenbacteria bacterium]|nr:ABC transporter ATP-binding protein [Candidatus Eisenbacteria bacterium]